MKQKLNEINRVFWNKVFPSGRRDAKVVSLELVRLQKETIRVFCEETLRFKSIQGAAQSIGILISAPVPKPEPELGRVEHFRHDWTEEEKEHRKALNLDAQQPEPVSEPAALEMGVALPSEPPPPTEPEKPKKRRKQETILPDDGPWPESIKKGFAP